MGGFANNAPIVTDGLVFYVDAGNGNSYPGSGTTWSDLVGGNDGTFSATPTTGSGNGGSIVFDGVDDLCSFPSDASPVTDAISVGLWYNGHPTVNNESATVRSEYGTGDTQRIFSAHIPWSDGTIYWDCGTNGAGSYDRIYKSSGNVHRGWNYWVFWKDANAASNRMKIYLNGSLWHQGAGGTKTMPSATAFTIGGRSQGDEYDNGTFSNVSIYNRALSAAEITQNYNALKNRFV
jgi:hypothetical protein